MGQIATSIRGELTRADGDTSDFDGDGLSERRESQLTEEVQNNNHKPQPEKSLSNDFSQQPKASNDPGMSISYSSNETYAASYASFIPGRESATPDTFAIPNSLTEEHPDPLVVPCNISNTADARRWEVCDPPECKLNQTLLAEQIAKFPTKTIWGEDTGDFVDRVLRKAWGHDPPTIDLYVRTFCPDAAELSLMLQTVEVFWPRFLGEVLIVLDIGNEAIAEHLFPKGRKRLTHSYRVIYEHGYCMHPRMYSQYSYLAAGKYSNADFIVTFDTDAGFFHPVTPDLLFNKHKRMILPTSQRMAAFLNPPNSNFDPQQYFFTHIHDGTWGTAMVSQPVSFKRSTFDSFLNWIQATRGTCYEDLASRFAKSTSGDDYRRLCWMCQLGAFACQQQQHKGGDSNTYDIHITNKRHDPYLRYAVHYRYEQLNPNHPNSPDNNALVVSTAMTQGLCKAFGESSSSSIFSECATLKSTAFVDSKRWTEERLNIASRKEDFEIADRRLFARLKQATQLALLDFPTA